MKRISTLIFLVNKIKSEVTNRSLRNDPESDIFFTDNEQHFEPRETAVNAILNFARSLEVKKSKTAGSVEWNLN
jgi:hypothetical protein